LKKLKPVPGPAVQFGPLNNHAFPLVSIFTGFGPSRHS